MFTQKQGGRPMQSGLDAESQFVQGESPEEFAALRAGYFDRFHPTTPDQRFQVDNLIRNEWLLRRYHRVEAQLWEYQTTLCDRSTGVELGEAFSRASTIFMRLQRRVSAAEKAYKEAMGELDRLQASSEPQQIKEETAKLASFLDSGPEAVSPLRNERPVLGNPEAELTIPGVPAAIAVPIQNPGAGAINPNLA